MILHMKQHTQPSIRPFKFENHWLKHSDIASVTHNAWTTGTIITNTARRLQYKVQATQRVLSKWAADTYKKRDTYLRRSKWVV